MTRLQILTACFCFASLFANAQVLIKGNVLDNESQAPLPFASIAVPNTTTGTMTNAAGNFELQLKEGQTEIQVSYVGYVDTLITINENLTSYTISLDPYTFGLTEIIVTSLTPLEYVQKALEKHPSLIPDKPFETLALFASKSSLKNDESSAYDLNQAVYKTYFSDYANDTLDEASQLILYNFIEEGEFESILKKNKRLNKIARRKVDQDSTNTVDDRNSIAEDKEGVNININDVSGAGPSSALKETKSITREDFFNEEYFKKFTYTFGEQTFYQGRELIKIDFSNKRKVEYAFYTGSIYLDHQDLAIVAIDYHVKAKIPFYINALLKTIVGFTIPELERDVRIRNQFVFDKWYPKELVSDMDLTLKQKGELETISIAQILNIQDVDAEHPKAIDEEKVFSEENEFEDQVFPIEGIDWEDINIIKIEDK